MATFWEIAARSVRNVFIVFGLFVIFIYFPSGICLLIAPVPVHCFSITNKNEEIKRTLCGKDRDAMLINMDDIARVAVLVLSTLQTLLLVQRMCSKFCTSVMHIVIIFEGIG